MFDYLVVLISSWRRCLQLLALVPVLVMVVTVISLLRPTQADASGGVVAIYVVTSYQCLNDGTNTVCFSVGQSRWGLSYVAITWNGRPLATYWATNILRDKVVRDRNQGLTVRAEMVTLYRQNRTSYQAYAYAVSIDSRWEAGRLH